VGRAVTTTDLRFFAAVEDLSIQIQATAETLKDCGARLEALAQEMRKELR
jgi:hypothetical protein